MPARDIHHDLVHRLLLADGWRITHDPYRIVVGRKNLFVDLGAEKIIAAERDGNHIAVEIKSIGQGLLAEYNLRLLVFDPFKEVILQWIPIP
jgi:hypothetical protein